MLYDGNESELLEREMRLSDAFDGDSTALELIVTSYNINQGLNQPLLCKCEYLNDYSILVGEIMARLRSVLTRREAISCAVKSCLMKGVMGKYLVEHAEEATNMLALEWKLNDALQARFEDGMEDGISQGIESVALNMIDMGMSLDKIQEATNLSGAYKRTC